MSEVKTQLQDTINAAGVWMTQRELGEALGRPSGTTTPLLQALVDEGAIQKIKPPAGFVKGAWQIYGALNLAPPQGEPVADKPARRLPKKTKGFRAEAHERARAKKRRASVVLMKRETTYGINPAPANRWALTSDGAFVLMGTSIEIPRPAARVLVDFVRTLDEAAA